MAACVMSAKGRNSDLVNASRDFSKAPLTEVLGSQQIVSRGVV
jgi:hypothetical protein